MLSIPCLALLHKQAQDDFAFLSETPTPSLSTVNNKENFTEEQEAGKFKNYTVRSNYTNLFESSSANGFNI